MSASHRIGRRLFIVTALGLTATTLAVRLGLKREAIHDDSATDAQRLLRAFSNHESAAELGRAYLATAPREGSPTVLVELITAKLPAGSAELRTADDGQIRSLLAQQVKEDFSSGNSVAVDGWIISKTEARLCALATLLT
jgi:hypothetical protein